MLDVNAGIPLADEPAILAAAVKLVQSVTDVPLSIDSSIKVTNGKKEKYQFVRKNGFMSRNYASHKLTNSVVG